ncbi:MAG: FKBP-type peptidyl-prolyl cis-trans isomerase [Paludibacteraceae bacterium]|nr:FKBP-type peptidyl-prolyl cis-trans isomerase [Paludibacteraceae bacterium]
MKRIAFSLLIISMLVSCGDHHFKTWHSYNDTWYENYKRDSLYADTEVKRVEILPSGVIIQAYHDGPGAIPKPTVDPVRKTSSSVYVSMDGHLADGTLFLLRGTASYELSDLVPGLREAMSLMRQGSHWKIIVPASGAYGKEGSKGTSLSSNFTVPPYSVLIFDIDLIDVQNY